MSEQNEGRNYNFVNSHEATRKFSASLIPTPLKSPFVLENEIQYYNDYQTKARLLNEGRTKRFRFTYWHIDRVIAI